MIEWILFAVIHYSDTAALVIPMEDQRACEYAKRKIKEINDNSPFSAHAVCFPAGTIPLPSKVEK